MTSLSDTQNLGLDSHQAGATPPKLPPGSPLQACPHCEALFDITEREPLEIIACPGCGNPIQIRAYVDHFQIVEEAGRGGMGIVYKAYDSSLDRYIAIKLLRKDHSEDARLVAQLEAEAAMTAAITDPNVVRVYGTGTDRGRFYLAMELVDKGSLDDLIRIQGRVAERQVLEVGIQIAKGLRAAYQNELIHRDVKPGNILFSDANTAKIVDFGLAIFLAQEEASRGEIWGTPYYVAPEKLDHQPEDFRSDMYSLGGTLFHALTGRPPFEAETASLVALKHLKSQPVSLQTFAPWVSNPTAHIINRTLTKDPDERYQSYDELIDNLEYALSELQKQGEIPQARHRVVLETEEDQKTITWVVLGALATVVVLLMCFFVFRSKGDGRAVAKSDAVKAGAADAGGASAQVGALKKELDALAERNAKAPELFHIVAVGSAHAPTERAWAQFLEGVAQLSTGHAAEARKAFEQVGPLASRIKDDKLAAFLRTQSALFSKADPIVAGDLKDLKRSSHEAIALLVAGLHNWQLGRVEEGAAILRDFRSAAPTGNATWVSNLKPLATSFIEDLTAFTMQANQLKTARTTADRAAAATELRKLNGAFARRADEAIAPYAKELADYAAEAAKAPSSGLFRIVNKNSNKLLDVEGFRTSNGAKVVQWAGAGGLNQLWQVSDLKNGYRRLRPAHADLSLDVPKSTTEAGAQIQLWTPNDTSAQRWRLETAGDGYFKIRSECSGLLLAIREASQENAASLTQVAETTAATALWKFERVGETINEWQHCEINPADSSGTVTLNNGVFTVKNKSKDIWGNADAFSFTCRNVSGDFEFTARVIEVSAAHEWSKAGIMARGSLLPNQRNVALIASANRIVSHQRRLQDGSESTSTKLTDTPAPRWLKLVRVGNKLTSFQSLDGSSWTEVATDAFNPAPAQFVVGLCVTSHDVGKETTAKFDNVKLTRTGK